MEKFQKDSGILYLKLSVWEPFTCTSCLQHQWQLKYRKRQVIERYTLARKSSCRHTRVPVKKRKKPDDFGVRPESRITSGTLSGDLFGVFLFWDYTRLNVHFFFFFFFGNLRLGKSSKFLRCSQVTCYGISINRKTPIKGQHVP